jgi:hypothetical protein
VNRTNIIRGPSKLQFKGMRPIGVTHNMVQLNNKYCGKTEETEKKTLFGHYPIDKQKA